MMKTIYRTLSLLPGALLALALVGCAAPPPRDEAMLTYETSPEGATILEGSQSLGTAPVTRTYKSDGKGGKIRTPDVTAVWPSGAKVQFFTLLDPGADRVATLERPANAPGLQADLDHAKKFASSKDREKDSALREQLRNSARCREQMSKGTSTGVDNCN